MTLSVEVEAVPVILAGKQIPGYNLVRFALRRSKRKNDFTELCPELRVEEAIEEILPVAAEAVQDGKGLQFGKPIPEEDEDEDPPAIIEIVDALPKGVLVRWSPRGDVEIISGRLVSELFHGLMAAIQSVATVPTTV